MNYPMSFVWVVAAFWQGCAEPPTDYGPPPGPEWEHCPGSDSYVGDSGWKGTLVVLNDAVYCEYPGQNQSLERALTLRKQLRVVAGSYSLPTDGKDMAFSLPICLRDEHGGLSGVSTVASSV